MHTLGEHGAVGRAAWHGRRGAAGRPANTVPPTPSHTPRRCPPGHDFIPDSIHAGGLRYHGMSPLISHVLDLGLIEARAVPQSECFDAALKFAKTGAAEAGVVGWGGTGCHRSAGRGCKPTASCRRVLDCRASCRRPSPRTRWPRRWQRRCGASERVQLGRRAAPRCACPVAPASSVAGPCTRCYAALHPGTAAPRLPCTPPPRPHTRRETGEPKVILTALCGHGFLDLPAYDVYVHGKLQDVPFSKERLEESLKHLPSAA